MFVTRDLTNNVNVSSENIIISPAELTLSLPAKQAAIDMVYKSRKNISRIIHRKDPRMLVIVGPCSIHDINSAKEYAYRLKKIHDAYSDNLFIVMRVYFEKPRTSTGWKGFINDPDMDDSFKIEKGLTRARELLIYLAELGLPAATEALDPLTPQYLSELISWVSVGARTTESQIHREMASGLSMPVGFKNGTDGNIEVAVNAMKSATSPHSFIGINANGRISIIKSKGNTDVHLVLRGGKQPNYKASYIAMVEETLATTCVDCNLIIDCSHGNSMRDYKQQISVAEDISLQIQQGNNSIIGLMLESHLREGRQSIIPPKNKMEYGISVTDACIGWDETESVISDLNKVVAGALKVRFKRFNESKAIAV